MKAITAKKRLFLLSILHPEPRTSKCAQFLDGPLSSGLEISLNLRRTCCSNDLLDFILRKDLAQCDGQVLGLPDIPVLSPESMEDCQEG